MSALADTARDRPGLAILAPPVLALGAALVAQYVFGLAPCELCIWQRWPYVAAIAIGLLALVFPRFATPLLVLAALAFATTAGIGVFHAGVEEGLWKGLESCSDAGTPDSLEALKAQIMGAQPARCDQVAFWFLGLSMAGWNVVFGGLATLAMLALAVARPRGRA
ncbi:MAG: disulfide bond formation protein B [Pseudomonadota bacterium]|nr:disulfide bond formation protein B [Pseudomonadota bacterium]